MTNFQHIYQRSYPVSPMATLSCRTTSAATPRTTLYRPMTSLSARHTSSARASPRFFPLPT